MIGMITGTLFVIFVTRRLSPEEFGLWTLIGSMLVYVTIIQPVITYWSTRQLARGEDVGKTAFASGWMFSGIGFIGYSLIAIAISFQLGTDLFILLLAGALIPLTFLSTVINGISLSYKPQNISYGLVVFESVKVPIGFLLVVFMDLGIVGAILTSIAASGVRLIFLIILSREKLLGVFKKHVLKLWLKLSWLSIFISLPGMLISLDVLLVSFFTNSLLILAFWGSAHAISGRLAASESLTQGLYPKLLSSPQKEIATLNLKRTLYFAIPFLGLVIVFAKPLLHILNPIYADAYLILIILSIKAIVALVMNIFFNIIGAYENIDKDSNATFREYVQSKLFFIPTLKLILTGAYLSSLSVFLFLYSIEYTEIEAATIWALIFAIIHIPFLFYGYIIIKNQHQIAFPFVSVGKYIGATLVSSTVVYFLILNYLTYSQSIWDFIPQFFPILILGGTIYFGITFLVDKNSRELFYLIFKEFKR
jgi:hypothetical protein